MVFELRPPRWTLLPCLFVVGSVSAQSSDRLFVSSDVQAFVEGYSGSLERDSLETFGLFVRADYLERGGFTLGYNRTRLGFVGGDDIDQDSIFGSARWNLTPDWAAGKLTLRIDGHAVTNNDPTEETDDVSVVAPQVSYLNYDETFYLDVGFAGSSYAERSLTLDGREVDQWTTTLGLGFNERRDWLQLRAYLIDVSGPVSTVEDGTDTAALEVKWTHWMTSRSILGLDNVRVSALVGERVFAVDPDAGAVYNLADLQAGGITFGGQWAPSDRSRILLLLGAQRFEDRSIDDRYDGAFVYFDFTYDWE